MQHRPFKSSHKSSGTPQADCIFPPRVLDTPGSVQSVEAHRSKNPSSVIRRGRLRIEAIMPHVADLLGARLRDKLTQWVSCADGRLHLIFWNWRHSW